MQEGTSAASDSTNPVPGTAFENPADAGRARRDGVTSALGRYFSELARHRVFTKTQELAAAKEIASKELAFWRVVLSHSGSVVEVAPILRAALRAAGGEEQQSAEGLLETHLAATAGSIVEEGCPVVEQLARTLRRYDNDRSTQREVFERAQSWAEHVGGEGSAAAFAKRLLAAYESQIRAKQRFAAANLRLVVTIAKRYHRGALPLADLIQEGNLGLMTAIERFDPGHGCRFSTYASWWIRHAVSRAVADKARVVRIPVHRQEITRRVARLTSKSLARSGKAPSINELARETGASKLLLERVRRCSDLRSFSLDRKIGDADGASFVDLLRDESIAAPDEAIITDETNEVLAFQLERLSPTEQYILRWRFGLNGSDERTLRELGDELSLSRERVRQLQNRALQTLRQRLEASKPPVLAAAIPALAGRQAEVGEQS